MRNRHTAARSTLVSSNRRRLTGPVLAGSLAVLCLAAGAPAQGRYRVAPLPGVEGGTLSALDLNNSNQVAGSVFLNGQSRPCLISDGAVTILDQVPGSTTTATAVSDHGHVAGWMYEWGIIWPQAFLWDGVENHWLIDPHDSYSYAQGLNNLDQVVGFYYPPGGHPNGNAFVVSGRRFHNLGGGQATDISAGGVIVGQSNRYFGATTVWSPDGRGGWSMLTLDGLLATAINEDGTMFVGAGPLISYFDTAVLWTRQGESWERTDIGGWDPTQVSAISRDVNNAGQVVGDYESFIDEDRGWIYENGAVAWLGDRLAAGHENWSIVAAGRINESGVILADAIAEGESRAVPALLIPEGLVMLAPRGEGAGASNELIAIGAEPGRRISFLWSPSAGQRALPGCPGVSIGLEAPRLIGVATADARGEARLSRFVPRAAAGRTIRLQAVDAAGCAVSNVLRTTLR